MAQDKGNKVPGKRGVTESRNLSDKAGKVHKSSGDKVPGKRGITETSHGSKAAKKAAPDYSKTSGKHKATNFEKAFAAARKEGKKEFTFGGKKYNTKRADGK